MQAHLNADARTARLTGKLRWMFWIGLGASAVLMAVACRGDLAIDEVISLQKAEGVKTWIEIVTQNQNDNNHLLNTFFLRLFGSQQNLFIYRIPAVLFGIATVAALGLAARRWGKEESVWVVYLAGLSSPVILYCSEARGYAPAMFFAVVSFELLQRCRERRTPVKLLLFWTTLCLGFLAHFSFAIICAGLGGWSLFHERAAGISRRGLLVNLARYFALPAVFMSCIYLVYIRHVIILGGMICSRREVIGAGASAALGLPDVAGCRPDRRRIGRLGNPGAFSGAAGRVGFHGTGAAGAAGTGVSGTSPFSLLPLFHGLFPVFLSFVGGRPCEVVSRCRTHHENNAGVAHRGDDGGTHG